MSRGAWTVALACGLASIGPAGCDDPPPDPPPTSIPRCDAGDEAWIKQTLQVLLGRKPEGIREVRVLQAVVARSDRPTAARVIMEDPAFEQRWAEFFMDEVRVNRDGVKNFAECFETSRLPGTNAELARALRDHGPDEAVGRGASLADVLHSSLRLDDVTPFYRAWLFGILARPSYYCPNLTPIENDLGRRRDFGIMFSTTYLHRSAECLPCHNSGFSTTFNPDPARNRFWPTHGNFEVALYGAAAGRDEMETYQLLRHLGVVTSAFAASTATYEQARTGGVTPWGLSPACGEFDPPDRVSPDMATIAGYFGGPQGATASVWDAERLLRRGLDEVARTPLPLPPGHRLSGAGAFAYLLAQRIVHQVWTHVIGAPLTLSHGFPRNEQQRDILAELTSRFVANHFSPKRLLVDIVTHPLYNQRGPAAGCGPGPYTLPPVFNPWSIHEDAVAARGNSVGDALVREDARTLMHAVSRALGWRDAAPFPTEAEARFQHSVGAFVSENRSGFGGSNFQQMLSWESRFGACVAPREPVPAATPVGVDPNSCAGRCDVLEPPESEAGAACACDAICATFDDCCMDYRALCVDPAPPRPRDWIDDLGGTAEAWTREHPADPPRIRDVVQALKDRLLTSPDLDEEESAGIAGLYGVASLDTPLAAASDWRGRTRMFCGVLLKSPQFMLRNLAEPDQAAEPRLTVGPTSFRELCVRWSGPVRMVTGRPLSCDERELSF